MASGTWRHGSLDGASDWARTLPAIAGDSIIRRLASVDPPLGVGWFPLPLLLALIVRLPRRHSTARDHHSSSHSRGRASCDGNAISGRDARPDHRTEA